MATLVRPQDRILPTIGAVVLVLALVLLLALPILYGAFMLAALTRLHLTPGWAAAIVLAMLFGGLINIPVKRYRRDDLQPIVRGAAFNLGVVFPEARLAHSETLLAVNLGGCVIPTLLALYELTFVAAGGSRPLLALAIAAIVNIFICYKCATPVRGVGMAVPAFIPPIAAVLITWMLLSGNDYDGLRAPAAFIAGVAGPLVGGHLLHLGKVRDLATGMASIGGAGTFDGIVFASVVAAFFA